jgi:hypothetical protein
MSDETELAKNPPPTAHDSTNGLNLALIYGLVATVLLVAMGIAALIVFPFYRHRH